MRGTTLTKQVKQTWKEWGLEYSATPVTGYTDTPTYPGLKCTYALHFSSEYSGVYCVPCDWLVHSFVYFVWVPKQGEHLTCY